MPIEESHLKRMAGTPWIGKVPPMCPECGYNLTGLPHTRCPECGKVFLRKDLEQLSRQIAVDADRLKGINDVLIWGLKAAVAGFVLIGAGLLLNMLEVVRFVGFPLGVLTAGLGASVFRALRLPKEVARELNVQPNYALGVSVMLLGLLLGILCITLT